jgi:uncharacterized protein YndB with AHSA1/START domain
MGEAARSDADKRNTSVERVSDHELLVTRTFDAPVPIVYAAWTTPALFMRWWAPRSMGIVLRSCDMDVRTGGGYRIAFGKDAETESAFFGRYLEVIANERLVWTNEEGPDGAVTTVSFRQVDNGTLLTFHERYPNKEALDDALIGMAEAMPEQFAQLDDLLASAKVRALQP